MIEAHPSNRYLYMILSALFVTFLGFIGWLGVQVGEASTRLTRIETVITENREERLSQVVYLERRIDRLEEEAFRRRQDGSE